MKHASLIATASILAIANLFALVHAARNRAGTPEAEMTLTNRELRYYDFSAANDDSGVTLHLQVTDPNNFPLPGRPESHWLNRQKLEALGFDCRMNPDSPDAGEFYQRQRPRRAFVALEYDGAAWRNWLDSYEQSLAEQRAKTRVDVLSAASYQSHLVAVDADVSAGRLRARYPDRGRVLIVPAVIGVNLQALVYSGADPRHAMQVLGHIQQYPSDIQVPHPLNDWFRGLRPRPSGTWSERPYRVHVRYGPALEPWVTGVEFDRQ